MPTPRRGWRWAAALRGWRYDRYRTKLKDKQKPTLDEVTIVGGGAEAGRALGAALAAGLEGVKLTRELVTEPANIIYPESFVERVRAPRRCSGIDLDVLDGAAMKKLGMGALLGVAQGSVRDARLLVLRWNGGKDGDAADRVRRQGRHFRHRRHLDQARRRAWKR